MWADTLAKGYPYTHAAKTMSQVDLQLIADRQRTVIISGRGLDPKVCRLFIVDGAKALSKVIRRIFGAHTPIQRCQIHKARNVTERLPKPLHASVRRALRQAWELDDADKAERLLRNLARRLEQQAPGVAASLLEGLDEMLTVTRLKLPTPLRRSLACTNAIENIMGTVRRVCRNVKRWRDAAMALAGRPPACWKRPRASID
jgi:transposase-like protein